MIYRKENKREQSEHLFSPDKSTKNTKYSEIMRVRSTSHNITYEILFHVLERYGLQILMIVIRLYF